MKTPVIFYTASYLNHEPAQTGITETIAVFPNSSNEHYQNGLLTSYAHVGQHTPISLDFIEQHCTKITDPKNYSELLEELKGQGYDNLDILNISKSILEQNYTSCLNFVEENNIQNEAIVLFGEDWECEDDCVQIENLLDFIFGDNHFYEVDFLENHGNEYDIKISKNYRAEESYKYRRRYNDLDVLNQGIKVYCIDTSLEYDNDALIDEDTFIKSAIKQELVYSLSKFQNHFNNGIISTNTHYIKIITTL